MLASQNAFFISISPPRYRCNPARSGTDAGRKLYKENSFSAQKLWPAASANREDSLEPLAYSSPKCTIIHATWKNQEL
jgi:hypothetical protein